MKHLHKKKPKRHHFALPTLLRERSLEGKPLTLSELKEMLQAAIQLEHTTIPPYLCALYSIHEGTNDFAVQTIRSIVMEEMLHMVMVANILNAIGGTPQINRADFIPSYPTQLPYITEHFEVGLGAFSKKAIDTFCKIERSAEHKPHEGNEYHSIGEFYAGIQKQLEYLDKDTPGGIFTGDPKRQVTSEQYYGGGGEIVSVYNLADATKAIEQITGQGEGIDGTLFDSDHEMFGEDIEYAHYFKFNEIRFGRRYKPSDSPDAKPSGKKVDVDWKAVYPMVKNPKMKMYPVHSDLWEKAYHFNKTYMFLLENIHQACNGQPALLMKGVGLMYDLKYQAIALMKTPFGNETAGPGFEFVAL